MNSLRILLSRCAAIFRKRKLEEELDEELRTHVDFAIEENRKRGMSEQEARTAALRTFGGIAQVKETYRIQQGLPFTETLFREVKYALRVLRKSPGFAITTILTLALGVGANVVVFSVLNALILKPLNVPQPNNLVEVVRRQIGWDSQSYPDYLDFRDHNSSFSGIIAYQELRAGMTVGTTATRNWGYIASGNYFDVLGIHPLLGRFFHSSDEHGANSAPYIVLSYDFWRSRFNRDPHIVGTTVDLNRHPFTVIGVAPKDFHGIELFYWPDYWAPLVNQEQISGSSDLTHRDHYAFIVVGRLKPGVTSRQAAESMNALTAQMSREHRKDDGLVVRLIRPGLEGDRAPTIKNFLIGIMLLALLVLLAACANLASIFAARATERSRELAIRLAIGSTRWNILRQLLTEAVILSMLGGIAGTLIAKVLLETLSRWQPLGDIPARLLVVPDLRVYLAALFLSLFSGLLFGMIPARQVWRTAASEALKSGSSETRSFRHFSLRDLLLTLQIALCTLLVTASFVAIRGMERSLHAPVGFRSQNATLAETALQMAGYSNEQALTVQRRMLEEASRIPGVTDAAIADFVPLAGGGGDWFVYKQGTAEFVPSHVAFDARTYLVSPGYLRTAETKMLAGRSFTWHDDANAPNVAIVNETFAHRLFGDRPAIGEHFALWGTAVYEIVGIVENGKYTSLTENPKPAMFLPLAQGVGGHRTSATTLVVRSRLPADQITSALRRTLTNLEPNLPFTLHSWPDALDLVLFPARAAAVALGIMGFLAAMLAVTGVFGMAAYSVSKRMKEHGIRIALGARRVQLIRAALSKPLVLLLCGSAIGLISGIVASRVLAQIVYQATPGDPLVVGGAIVAMGLSGLLATWIPARKALSIDPARLLREE